LCGIGSQHSNISKGKGEGGLHIKITGMQDSNQGKVVMNKKNPEQISSGSFNYLLNLGRVTSEVRGVAKQCFD
jgi:hypothetical protein